jgi:CO/xanthine dehydrogenase FAD-binding subunit
LDEAYLYLQDEKGYILGGGAWSRMNPHSIDLAVDLSSLDLRYIYSNGQRIEIGAMTTARDVETSPDLQKVFGSLFADTVGHIVGVQMRNIVTVGGTVGGRFGFSELNTTLMALDAKVGLYKEGEIPIEDFLTEKSREPKLVEKVVIDTNEVTVAYKGVRKTHTDFTALNAAAAYRGGSWRIAVGARPGPARLSGQAAAALGSEGTPSAKAAQTAGQKAASELTFGSDIRGSADYRRQICEVLVRRAVEEAGK